MRCWRELRRSSRVSRQSATARIEHRWLFAQGKITDEFIEHDAFAENLARGKTIFRWNAHQPAEEDQRNQSGKAGELQWHGRTYEPGSKEEEEEE